MKIGIGIGMVIAGCLLAVILMCTSCDGVNGDGGEEVLEDRILLIEDVEHCGMCYQIVEVDGVEYLATYRGGIIKLDGED